MNIRHLKVFKAVCDAGSITKASEILYISQPAVSSTIADLEEKLQVNLFDRIGRNIELNETGKIFLSKVNELLKIFDDLESSSFKMEECTPLKIGSSITVANSFLPKVIKNFNLKYPNVKVYLEIRNARDIEYLLKENKIDLGIIEGPVIGNDFDEELISKYVLKVVASDSFEIANNKLNLENISDYDFLLRERGSAIRDVFDSVLMLHNISIDPLWTSINSQTLISATYQGLGLTILPESLVNESIEKKVLKEIKIEDFNFENKISIIKNRNKVISKPLEILIQTLREI